MMTSINVQYSPRNQFFIASLFFILVLIRNNSETSSSSSLENTYTLSTVVISFPSFFALSFFLGVSLSLSLMEFDTKYREDLSFKPTFLQENYLKPEFDDGFSSIEACTSKGIFQKFDQQPQFPVDGFLLSSKPNFGLPGTAYVDPFEAFITGNSSNFDFFESKPFIDEGCSNGFMEKFHNSTNINRGGGGGGGGFLNYPLQGGGEMMMMIEQQQDNDQHQQMNHLMPAAGTLVNFGEVETHVNLGIPDEYSCVTGDNGIYREVGLNVNSNKKNMPMKRNGKAKKSSLVKGQWTMEEDR